MQLRLAAALFALCVGLDVVLIARDPSPWIVPAVICAWLLADFGSGLLHMLLDYYPSPPELQLDRLYFHRARGSEDYRRLKAEVMARTNTFHRLVFDFKRHHPWPDTLGRRPMATLCRETLLFGGLPTALLVSIAGLAGVASTPVLAFGLTMAILATFAQYFHGTLHRVEPPRPILWLRRARILMTPEQHQVHHDHLDRDFAIVNGFANPLLNPIFRLLRDAGICREENLEPPRTDATRGIPSPDPRPGLRRAAARA